MMSLDHHQQHNTYVCVLCVCPGRLVASLLQDFLQVFHLDFTLAVFQPEINSVSVLVSSVVHDGAPARGDVLLFLPLKPVYSQSGLKTVCCLLPITLDFTDSVIFPASCFLLCSLLRRLSLFCLS